MFKNLFLIVFFSCFLTGCTADYTAVYQSVNAENKWVESGKIIVSHSKDALPLFKVIDNKLYLMIQLTQVEWFLRTVVSYPSWDKAEMRKLIQAHSDIESLIPVDWNNWLAPGFGEECKPNSTTMD